MESQLIFAPLPGARSRWKSLLVGWGLQALVMLAVLAVNALSPNPGEQVKRYVVSSLVAPPEHVIDDTRRVNPRPAVKPVATRVETVTVSKLIVPHPVHQMRKPDLELKPPDMKLTSTNPQLPWPSGAPVSKIVATNEFATLTNRMPTTNKPAAQVQTGGFGDPNGIATMGNGKHDMPIAARGNLGLLRDSGFGDGFRGPVGLRGVERSAIQSSGFDKQYVPPAAKRNAIATNEPGSPVEIIDKPKPTYTEEGRKHGVQGEVRLEVQFTADGHVRVLRVLQGLGFGLDEQALRCAQQIRFKPATHGGQPIDSMAIVHIIFELVS